MDPMGDNSELRTIIEQQGEKIGQLTSIIELVARQLSGVNQQRNDPPLPPTIEGDQFNDAEIPRGEIHKVEKEKAEKERYKIVKMQGKMENFKRVIQKTNGVDSYMLELKGCPME